jgi:hypothetical protein
MQDVMDRSSELNREHQSFRGSAASHGFDWKTPALAIALAFSGWALGQVYGHSDRIARLETSLAYQQQLLERIDSKLDGLNR